MLGNVKLYVWVISNFFSVFAIHKLILSNAILLMAGERNKTNEKGDQRHDEE